MSNSFIDYVILFFYEVLGFFLMLFGLALIVVPLIYMIPAGTLSKNLDVYLLLGSAGILCIYIGRRLQIDAEKKKTTLSASQISRFYQYSFLGIAFTGICVYFLQDIEIRKLAQSSKSDVSYVYRQDYMSNEEIQRKLNELGYNAGSSDGVYVKNWEPLTEAIKQFQSDHNLERTGTPTIQFLDKLSTTSTPKRTASSSSRTAGKQTTSYSYTWEKDYYSIINLQRKLNDLGYNAGSADGVLGGKTIAAIKQYQADNNIPVSGVLSNQEFSQILNTSTPKRTVSSMQRTPSQQTASTSSRTSSRQTTASKRTSAIPKDKSITNAWALHRQNLSESVGSSNIPRCMEITPNKSRMENSIYPTLGYIDVQGNDLQNYTLPYYIKNTCNFSISFIACQPTHSFIAAPHGTERDFSPPYTEMWDCWWEDELVIESIWFDQIHWKLPGKPVWYTACALNDKQCINAGRLWRNEVRYKPLDVNPLEVWYKLFGR